MYLKSGAGTVMVVMCFLESGSAIPLVFLLFGMWGSVSSAWVYEGFSGLIKSDTLKWSSNPKKSERLFKIWSNSSKTFSAILCAYILLQPMTRQVALRSSLLNFLTCLVNISFIEGYPCIKSLSVILRLWYSSISPSRFVGAAALALMFCICYS